MTGLPDGWVWSTLGEVGSWRGGGTPSKNNRSFWDGGTIPWLSPKDMGAPVLSDTRDHITPGAVAASSTSLVPAGSVVLVVRSGILERTVPIAYVPFETTLNQDMKAIVPHQGVSSRWLLYVLQSQREVILSRCRKDGTTVASLDTRKLQALPVPVPPLAEQHRLVGVIDDHLSRLDAADNLVNRPLRRLRTLRESALAQALDEASLSVGVEVATIGALGKVSSGMTPLKSNRSFYDGGMIPWITSGDLYQGVINEATQFVTQTALDKTTLKMLPAGSLLVAMYGEGKTRGTVAQLGIDATTNQACAAILLDEPELIPWVRLVLDANYAKFRRAGAGGVQPNLNLSIVKAVEVPIPAESTRARLVEGQAALVVAEQRLRRVLVDTARRSLNLRQSILLAAFSGELGDQELKDEPASFVSRNCAAVTAQIDRNAI